MLTLGAVVVTDCRRTLSSVEVAINALAGWSGARLYHVLREGLGATYGLYSEFVARRVQSVLSGEFRIYGSIETARLDDAMARLRRELATVADGDLGADAVLRSRANIAGREAMLTQTVRSVVDVAGARFRRGFAADEQAERVDDLMSVTPSGAALDAARFLALGRLQLAVVGEPSACERAVAPLADEAGVPLIVVPPGG
jgi:predicted Zn-dependent peptidase